MVLEHPPVRRGKAALVTAAVVGTLHGLVSLYWGAGGEWLVGTLGEELVDLWRRHAVLLVPVGLVKILAALAPLLLLTRVTGGGRRRVLRRALRGVSWAGAAVLVAWGGLNTVTGNLVLGGVVVPDGGYDREGMIGHAWLWDPMFLLWGVALAAGLWGGRPGAVTRS
ncbi:DUF3995 domain-containing protein [Corynebacteriaceae bacterium 7-707]